MGLNSAEKATEESSNHEASGVRLRTAGHVHDHQVCLSPIGILFDDLFCSLLFYFAEA